MKTTPIILSLTIIITGCAMVLPSTVPDAEGVEPVSADSMSCSNPFPLKQDCSQLIGPEKEIILSGLELKVAGNKEGTITVMFADDNEKISDSSNLGYDLMKAELVSRNFSITRVTPIKSGRTIYGYAIETTKPSYQIWSKFAAKGR